MRRPLPFGGGGGTWVRLASLDRSPGWSSSGPPPGFSVETGNCCDEDEDALSRCLSHCLSPHGPHGLTMVAPPCAEAFQMPVGWRATADQRKKVLAHLGTDEERLDADARSLRAWFNMQPHLPFLPESELVMLKAYLLNCKNSMEKSKKGLDNYFTARTVHYDFFGSYNINEEELVKCTRTITLSLAKDLTPDLTRVIVANLSGDDQSEEDFARMCRLNLLKADTAMRMDTNLGIELVVDLSYFTPNHAKQTLLNFGLLKTYFACIMGALPTRMKKLHLVNAPPFYAASFNLIQMLLKDKIKERVIMHPNLKSLYSYVSPRYLPKELGGDLPSCDETEALFRPVFAGFEDHYALQRTLKVDESRRPGGPSQMHAEANFGCEGSFRKLALD
ncbi:clavesin-1-like [Thrips palmi]|uniref:Clavesin-1-like n=1 Tax=Thrips palmi TaxID=161013 RepID=A0A6P8ZRK6_THRPL|nr:clavesin-1-like [Thrips palmi]